MKKYFFISYQMATRRGKRPTTFTEPATGRNVMDSFNPPMKRLGQSVLNDKCDIRFSSRASNPTTAPRFAEKHKLQYKYHDINDDQIDDVVLYDAKGEPVYINGYRLAPSEFKLRKLYHEQYDTKNKKLRVGGYTGFKKSFHSDFDGEKRAQYLDEIRDTNYLIPAQKASKRQTLYQIFSSHVVPMITKFMKDRVIANDPNKLGIISVLPAISITSNIWIDIIIRGLWAADGDSALDNAINEYKEYVVGEDGYAKAIDRYRAFKHWLTRHKELVNTKLEAEWDTIKEMINAEYMGNILDTYDFHAGFITDAGTPTDTEVRTSVASKIQKEGLKDVKTTLLYAHKAQLINEIFEGEEVDPIELRPSD